MGNKIEAAKRLLTNPAWLARQLGRMMTSQVVLSWAVLLLAGIAVWDRANPPPREYFGSNGRDEPYPMVPMSQPMVDQVYLLEWTKVAVLRAYSLNHAQYREQAQAAKVNWLPNAWNTWEKSYLAGGNLERLRSGYLTTIATTHGPPIVKQEGIVAGHYKWRIEFVMQLTYLNTNGPMNEIRLVSVLVTRTPDRAYPRGIALEQVVDSPAPSVHIARGGA